MAVGDKNKGKKKPPQTEEKAKGLIGLEKGKKVEGAAYSVGNYKGKTLNLSKKQIASSGVKGARKAAAAKATSISDTKYEKGKGVTVGGKAFTGKVDLGGGNMAVYVGGKRVAAKPKGGAGGGRGGSGGSGGSGGGGTKSAVQKAKDKMGKAAGYGKGAGTPSNLTGTSGGMGGPARTPRQQSAEYRRQAQAGRRAAGRPSVSATPKPREGERRTRMAGNRKVVEVYRGGSWLPLTGSRGGY